MNVCVCKWRRRAGILLLLLFWKKTDLVTAALIYTNVIQMLMKIFFLQIQIYSVRAYMCAFRINMSAADIYIYCI